MSEGFLPPIVAVLTANVKEFEEKMGQAAATSKAETEEMSGHASKFGMVAGAAFLAAGAAAFEIGKSVFETTEKFESAHVRLDQIVKNTGANVDVFNKSLEHQHNVYANLGIDATQYESALAVLVAATGNAKVAERDMAQASDLAAAKHMDLEAAAKLVGKVATGNVTVLKRYGIDLGITAGGVVAVKNAHIALAAAELNFQKVQEQIRQGHIKGVDAAIALKSATDKLATAHTNLTNAETAGQKGIDALTKKFGGSAAAQTETLGGKMAVLKAKVHNVEIEVGEKLNGALNAFGHWISGPQGQKALDTFSGAWEGLSGVLDAKVVPAVDHVTTVMANWLDSVTTKIAGVVDGITTDLAGAINTLDNKLADLLGGSAHGTGPATSKAEQKAMADRYDKAHGNPVGTTWRLEQGQGGLTKGHALGGIANYPAAGAMTTLHGAEAILPLDNPPAARRIAQEAGVLGGHGGGVHVHGPVSITIVSPDPAKSGEQVRMVLTDASFLRGRD